MARRSKSKNRSLPRGARGPSRPSRVRHDLDVPLPAAARSTDGRRRAAADRRCLLDRLRSTGYGTIAFSHTVFGRPHPEKDSARNVMPWTFADGRKEPGAEGGAGCEGEGGPLVLRRLNVVIEEASDVVRYSTSATASSSGTGGEDAYEEEDLIASYDLIAISARSDPAFTAACSNATAADVFVLDYTAGRGGVQLPHRIRAADVRAATERGAAFEIPYAPSVLDPAKRKAMVRTALELRSACTTVRSPRPRIILSSGSRATLDGADAGPMALRTPGDMANVMRAVLGFDDRVAFDAAGEAAWGTVERGRARRTRQTTSAAPFARSDGKGGDVFARVVLTEGSGADVGLRWTADEEAPLAGEMAEVQKKGFEEPRKKVAKSELINDVKGVKPSNDSAREGTPADEDYGDVGHEDGFMAL